MHTNILQSVVGNNVRIGSNVHIEKSTIMSDVVIMDHCFIKNCIVGPKSTINADCKLTSGCVLGPEVLLEQGAILEGAVIQSKEPKGNVVLLILQKYFEIHNHKSFLFILISISY